MASEGHNESINIGIAHEHIKSSSWECILYFISYMTWCIHNWQSRLWSSYIDPMSHLFGYILLMMSQSIADDITNTSYDASAVTCACEKWYLVHQIWILFMAIFVVSNVRKHKFVHSTEAIQLEIHSFKLHNQKQHPLLAFWIVYGRSLMNSLQKNYHEILRINWYSSLCIYSISQEICTRLLLCCALLWLYIDWFSHIHQAYFTGTVPI